MKLYLRNNAGVLLNADGDAFTETEPGVSGCFTAVVSENITEVHAAHILSVAGKPLRDGWMVPGDPVVMDFYPLDVKRVLDLAGWSLSLLCGAISNPQDDQERYDLALYGSTYTVIGQAQSETGHRGVTSLSKT